ncbi:rho GTPase-activating protein 19 isoform X2 [Cylas formicarius]|uniref:rho GTPase-activating protein 19 isoform X2 n=1 Tax=Cylas formicarius TaxID=197179 RepID=UPI002958A459|nr:rho GTPase-activating protein 19 isoform X2 [Cylas formicarius]
MTGTKRHLPVSGIMEFFVKDLKSDGIFRRTGSLERQNDLKNLLALGETVDFSNTNFSVHDCASVLKSYLAELPEPLLTDIHYPLYCQIGTDLAHESKILETVQLLFLLLPKENRELLRDVLDLLRGVATHETHNRMSAENLAKLFAPHLLCPRKLAPETLLRDSPTLFGVVAFMIKNFPAVFEVPSRLMLDLRAHRERAGALNESAKGAAHTVFTFVDNKLTAKENEENPTETALAQLYAHIQSLPESSKKRKLIKQFNKENGQGTPLQVVRSGVGAPKSKSIGDSIKKHMFHRKLMRNVRRGPAHLKKSTSEEVLHSPHHHGKTTPSGRRLFCHNPDSSVEDEVVECAATRETLRRSKSDPNVSDGTRPSGPRYLTSTPACPAPDDFATPKGEDRDSMSPITRSAQRMPRAMQETMMTPRSRKPVLLVSGTNITSLARPQQQQHHHHHHGIQESVEENVELEKSSGPPEKIPRLDEDADTSASSLTKTFREYLSARDIMTLSSTPVDSSFSTCTDDFNSSNFAASKMSDSLVYVLDGNDPDDGETCGKELVLKPRQFDEDGKPIVFETSF